MFENLASETHVQNFSFSDSEISKQTKSTLYSHGRIPAENVSRLKESAKEHLAAPEDPLQKSGKNSAITDAQGFDFSKSRRCGEMFRVSCRFY